MGKTKLFNFLNNIYRSKLASDLNSAPRVDTLFSATFLDNSELSVFIKNYSLSQSEIVILLTALVPHVLPDFFNALIAEFLPNGGEFPEFGGVKGKNHRGILPTGETILYVLGGKDIEKRMQVTSFFDESHLFARKNVLFIEQVPAGEPKMSGRLIMDEEFVDLFLSEKISRPKLSSDFPAQLIKTDLEWKDLVLAENTLESIREIETWLNYNEQLLENWELRGKIKPGYRILFYGPPGTGKTMTACLLGKYTKRDVFRVDLSMVVSKYIGETEKNLSKLFDKAAHKNWILFFDEADSIFGKRTNVRDAHDKYANQEVSYLLQRIEAHEGLVILASNMKTNIDSSFTRRFNSFVEFEAPDVKERVKLWENYIPESIQKNSEIDFNKIGKNYELSGANIVNAIQFAGLQTLQKNNSVLTEEDLLRGIKKEYKKEGKMLRKN
ncbi:ATP-binding protein [uncultured Draconibacterium sp.]|uniref:ATP-binding protein n=1 Tax=uncultured Draconibacterium sp. TaxID=1573823 RepID=UPI00321741CE